MPTHKRFYPDKGFCRVIFTLPKELSVRSKRVSVVGEFNSWQPGLNEMKRDKNGRFQCSIDLPIGHDYQFRYLIDKYTWESDWESDGLARTPFEETYNSVVNCKGMS